MHKVSVNIAYIKMGQMPSILQNNWEDVVHLLRYSMRNDPVLYLINE